MIGLVTLGLACVPRSPPEDFTVGINLPWLRYGHDFGEAWGPRGVSTPRAYERLDDAFDRLEGVEVVRWFVFGDGRALDQSTPHQVLQDVEIALTLADHHRLKVMPVLFDFKWFGPAVHVRGVQLYGRRDIALDPARRQALIDTWVAPLAERFANDPRIAAIDLINEPEWAFQAGDDAAMSDFVAAIAAPWWAAGDVPLTVGSASLVHTERVWKDWGLDLLQVHHYEPGPLPPREAWFGDTPVWVGEFPSVGRNVPAELRRMAALGYTGAMPWSMNGRDPRSDRRALRYGVK